MPSSSSSKSKYLLPDDFEIVNVDWEKQRQILPERYIVRLDDNVLDKHSYNKEDKIEERSPQAYELTKEKVKRALPLFRNIPLQIEHGTDGIDDKTGFTKVHQNRCVVGKVLKAWINPKKDNELLCEVKFDNRKNSSLLWNYALHHTKANRGVSLCSASDYDKMIPLEVSLVERGMRPNTGVVSVIDKDEKIIDFKEYRLQHDKTVDIPTPAQDPTPIEVDSVTSTETKDQPSAPPPPPSPLSSSSSSEMQVAPASANQPKDPVTGKFISVAEAQNRGLVPIPFTPAPPPPQQQQQMAAPPQQAQQQQGFVAPTPTQQQQQYEPETREYPMSANYNGVPHTNMIGTPMEGIAMTEHNRYQQEALAKAQHQAQAQAQQMAFNQAAASPNMPGGPPAPMKQPLLMQQQQQVAVPPQAQAQVQVQADTKMEDVEESQEAVDEWFDKATEEEKNKVYESVEKKIMSGRVKELTKRESLVHADRLYQNKKERDESAKKLADSSNEQKVLMQTFLSALSSLKPTTSAEEHKAMESMTPTQAVTQLVAAASAKVASLETQNQMYQQWLEETNKRQKQENSLPRHLQRIANQYADLSSSASTTPTYATMPYQQHPSPSQQYQQQQQMMTTPASYQSAPVPVQAPPQPPKSRIASYEEQKQLLASIMSGHDSTYYGGDYTPTSTPVQYQQQQNEMQIVPASYNSVGQKRSFNESQSQQPLQERYFPPNRNTPPTASEWLNHKDFGKYFNEDLRSSFRRAKSGKYLDEYDNTGIIPYHLICPDYNNALKAANAASSH